MSPLFAQGWRLLRKCQRCLETQMEKTENDAYERVLIEPILASQTLSQARARARYARKKLSAHEKATHMNIGDAVTVYDRITDAEVKVVGQIVRRESARHL